MPDISMCQVEDCPRKETCYRFIAIPDADYQSYADFRVICFQHPRKEFIYYWETKPKEEILDKEVEV